MTQQPLVVVAGAAGTLAQLMIPELLHRGVKVKGIVRPGTDNTRTASVAALEGVDILEIDLTDLSKLTSELQGAVCVVSALQGLQQAILISQEKLLDAAVAARVPRFIPSDYSLDFTKTQPGSNRNLDLRRAFHAKLEHSGIAWTSVMNGAFMDMLDKEMPLIDMANRKVRYVGNADQKLDFTTMANTAAFTAAVATDPEPTPKILRIAGDVVSARDLAEAAARADRADHFKPFSVSWIGGVGFYGAMGWIMRHVMGGENQVMPPWQGIQYMVDMFSGRGKLHPLDNDRYAGITWTKIEDFLRHKTETRDDKRT